MCVGYVVVGCDVVVLLSVCVCVVCVYDVGVFSVGSCGIIEYVGTCDVADIAVGITVDSGGIIDVGGDVGDGVVIVIDVCYVCCVCVFMCVGDGVYAEDTCDVVDVRGGVVGGDVGAVCGGDSVLCCVGGGGGSVGVGVFVAVVGVYGGIVVIVGVIISWCV